MLERTKLWFYVEGKNLFFVLEGGKVFSLKERYIERKIIKSKNINSFQKEEKILPTEKKNKMVKI